ncbi:MAG: hypothetical protein IPG63_13305 [Xanthomonadales bacterium]|jgi:hypothetical protein|nr:hypothetical protein [Xanthomonadales bacterium]MBK7146654.1 hypothetical protein [Xanthomonadales bacterium]
MHPIHIQQAPDTSELGLRFPDTRCVNCGTHQGLSEGVLELRQTTYLLVAGTELLLRFPVVSCERCAPTLARRALSLPQRLFLGALSIATVLTFVFMAVALDLDMPAWLKSHWFAASVLGGGIPAWLWFERHRPEHPQTSHYQPIRLKRLKRTFFGGRIDRMVLGFTHPDVLREFTALNRPLIDAGVLGAERA